MKTNEIIKSPMNTGSAALTEASLKQILRNADDPRIKGIWVAMQHDKTLPFRIRSQLGPRPTPDQIVETFDKILFDSLGNVFGVDLYRQGKFNEYLLKNYVNGVLNYEDIHGEAGETLGIWSALSRRNLLRPRHQDFNRFSGNLSQFRSELNIMYQDEIKKIRDAGQLEKQKRDQKLITLINNERYFVFVPLNYGACYIFNNLRGYPATYCTGSSNTSWFDHYNQKGLMINILDKSNIDNKNGKWQIHAATNQIVNAVQDDREDHQKNSAIFGQLFPGLMQDIVVELRNHADEIGEANHDAELEIKELQRRFPAAFAAIDSLDSR
jgi:hypothetical protein